MQPEVEFSRKRVLNEEFEIYGQPGDGSAEARRGRAVGTGDLSGTGNQFGNVLKVAGEVRRDGRPDDFAAQGVGTGESPAKENVRRGVSECRNSQKGDGRKVVRPSRRREMAKQALARRGVSIRRACRLITVRETCYRYEAKHSAENEQIADWLVRLTDN